MYVMFCPWLNKMHLTPGAKLLVKNVYETLMRKVNKIPNNVNNKNDVQEYLLSSDIYFEESHRTTTVTIVYSTQLNKFQS